MEEFVAILEFDRLRKVQLTSSVFAVSGSGANKIYDQLLGSIFPEQKLNQYDFFSKSSEAMKKMKGVELTIMPLDKLPKGIEKKKK